MLRLVKPQRSPLSYNVSSNGAAADWYWEVSSQGDIVARGLAPTRVRARADAITAAAPYLEGRQRHGPTLLLEEHPL